SRYYNIYTANNVETAIEMLRKYDIHMIITDQKMPEMSGTELLERTLEEFPDILRIILTGFADIQAIIKAINKCSIYKYITKPYENSEVKEIIEKGLEIYNMRREKYEASREQEAAEQMTQSVSQNDSGEPDDGVAALILEATGDLTLSDEAYESYFDFHINYKMPIESVGQIYNDFVVHADEESSQYYHVFFKTSADIKGSLAYLHFKGKIRSYIEGMDNNEALETIMNELTEFAVKNGIRAQLKIFSYNWESGVIQFLADEPCIKAYSIGEQLEPLRLKAKKATTANYQLYQATSESDLMVYFWDYQLADESKPEASQYFDQIIKHVTNVPFDLQASQIASGIKSVKKYFSDASLIGLYIND
ncbi:MAG: response regulator, partial [Bacteroidota bacterium]